MAPAFILPESNAPNERRLKTLHQAGKWNCEADLQRLRPSISERHPLTRTNNQELISIEHPLINKLMKPCPVWLCFSFVWAIHCIVGMTGTFYCAMFWPGGQLRCKWFSFPLALPVNSPLLLFFSQHASHESLFPWWQLADCTLTEHFVRSTMWILGRATQDWMTHILFMTHYHPGGSQ